MVILNELIKEFAMKGRGPDTEGTRASGITEKIVEGFVVEAQCSMNTEHIF